MKRILKSHIINTLPNIKGLDIIREKLETTEFVKAKTGYIKDIELDKELPIHRLIQISPNKESVDIKEVTQNIKKKGLKGYLIPTFLLKESLKSNPLPLSAQKQSIIEYICRMNNGKYNEAEGIHIIYERHHELDPLIHPTESAFLSPNLPSQVISTIHKHDSSRMTIGEAKSYREITKPYPYGEAIVQMSHLRYHVLDLDLSLEVTEDNIGASMPLPDKVALFESCYSFPFKLNSDQYSDHGFALYLRGDNITPKKIKEIIGLERTGFGGVIIATGVMTTSVLTKTKKGIFKKEEFYDKKFTRKDKEAVGSFTCDPALEITTNGYCDLERNGKLESINGEVVLAFFPLHQTFIGEYK